MYLLSPTFIDDELEAVDVNGQWLTPHQALDELCSRANLLAVRSVRWKNGRVALARASKRDNNLRICAGSQTNLTVLTAE